MWNNIDEAMQEMRHNYKELTQIINRNEKQIQFLETKALKLSMFYVAPQLALFLLSNMSMFYVASQLALFLLSNMLCCYINDSDNGIKLVEKRIYSRPGSHGCMIVLQPHRSCYHPAAKFASRNRHGGQSSTISIIVNDVERGLLMPEQFKKYIRLRFMVDSDGGVQIRGVKAIFSDHIQLWGWRFLGRNLAGRPEVKVEYT